MEFLSLFEDFNDGKYSALYICPLNLDRSHCHILGLYSDRFQDSLIKVMNEINKENYDWIVKLDIDKVSPGCIIGDSSKIKELAEKIYYKLESEIDCRVVYGSGDIKHVNEGSIHKSHGDLLIKIGKKLDSLKGKAGIYTI